MKTSDINKLYQDSIPNGEVPIARRIYVAVRAKYNESTTLFEADQALNDPPPGPGDYQFPTAIVLQISKDGHLQLGLPGNLVQGIVDMHEVVPV